MKHDIEFTKLSFADLESSSREHASTAYVGGSNRGTLGDFRAYIRAKGSKKLNREASFCGWACTRNAKAAEDKLLLACKDECPTNTHRRSNAKPAPGFVYLLL